ncbi:MAG: branched-chain amino acid aminotransferase [Salaquimonas sp.]
MAKNRQIWTWFEGEWKEGNVPIMGSADHGTWLGTLVFDGARWFEGVAPDLEKHCARLNHSADALGLKSPMSTAEILALAEEGCKKFSGKTALYIRPMAWSTEAGEMTVDADPDSTRFALCIEEASLPPESATTTLTTTRFTRPTLATATVNAKAACLYPNNARMLKEAQSKGFANVICCDVVGNVAETATSNIFMVKNGEYFTPIPNGCFLNGITRQRLIQLLRDNGEKVWETVLTLDDFRVADEIFLSGNYSKVTPAVKFEDKTYPHGEKTKLARKLYWEWAGL